MSDILSFIDSIASEPIKGIRVNGYWSEWEGASPGSYAAGFATIDAILARAAQRGKYVMLSPMPVNYGGYGSDWSEYFPKYIVDGSAYGVHVVSSVWGGGLIARFWQTATMDRLLEMSRAYAARYDSHPNVEMWVPIPESSVPVAAGDDGFSWAVLEAQYARMIPAMRQHWTKTALRFSANWSNASASALTAIVNLACRNGYVIGGPDVIPNETIDGNEVFTGALAGSTDWRGVVPFISEVQDPSLGGKEGYYTPAQIYAAAMKGVSSIPGSSTVGGGQATFRAVQPQYFLWQAQEWQGGAEQKWSTGILPFIRSVAGAVHSTSCPSGYSNGCSA